MKLKCSITNYWSRQFPQLINDHVFSPATNHRSRQSPLFSKCGNLTLKWPFLYRIKVQKFSIWVLHILIRNISIYIHSKIQQTKMFFLEKGRLILWVGSPWNNNLHMKNKANVNLWISDSLVFSHNAPVLQKAPFMLLKRAEGLPCSSRTTTHFY